MATVDGRSYAVRMHLAFTGELWFWKGPAPWHFITVPEGDCVELQAISELVSYGWGMIPAQARIGDTTWPTSLFPKDERYIVPIKTWVRQAESLELGQLVTVGLNVAG